MNLRARVPSLLALFFLAGCASAGDRLEDGLQLQAEGRFIEAAYRYADAVDKDRSLIEAQDRLIAATDTAIVMTRTSYEHLQSSGDLIAAADGFRDIDRLLARVREVGLRYAPPSDYAALRREAFDHAIEALMGYAGTLQDEGRFGEARRALVRARNDFSATSAQSATSLSAEVELLLDWGESDLDVGALKAAFAHAGQAVEVRTPPAQGVTRRADDIRNEALDLGTLRVAILPITSTAAVREIIGTEYQGELSDNLEVDYWRAPPPFVAVADPVMVRREARDAASGSRPLNARQVERVLDEVGADLGALIEVQVVQLREDNLREETKPVRLRSGAADFFKLVRGRLAVDVTVEVVIVDGNGRELETFRVAARETGNFERGVYEGNAGELELSRNEARYFDRDLIDEQTKEVERAALAELAENVATKIFDEIVSRVR